MAYPFRSIVVFHAVATSGSMLQAAQRFGVTPSAVSQQVKQLEDHIGTSLFHRQGRRLILTEAGERYLDMVGDEVDNILRATERIRGLAARTVLNVRAAPTFATKWIIPHLPAFLNVHPELDLRLDATSEPLEFGRDHVDLEIRHGRGNWTGLYLRKIGDERFAPLCAPSLIAPGSVEIADLARYPLIHSVKNVLQWPNWFADQGVEPPKEKKRLMFDRAHNSIDMAATGAGIALESHVTAWKELHDGRLACPLRAPPALWRVSLWYACPRANIKRRPVRQFMDWLDSTLRDVDQPPEGLEIG